MSRSVNEWVAKHDDQKVPPRVRQRVFDQHGGICHLTGRKIQPGEKWELEHIRALILGGQHRESNLAPALSEAHKIKTATEMKVKAKTDAVRKKHLGITRPKQTIKSPPFPKTEKALKRLAKPSLPPLKLYEAKP
jgi:5-methylcytosine-specific restriction endonuclease McrA